MKASSVAGTFVVVALVAVSACENSSSSPGTTAPDSSLGATDAPLAKDAVAEDALAEDARVEDTSVPDVKVPPVCLDAGDGADAGCLGALALFNTGVDATGAAATGGSVDLHYTLIQSAETTLPGPNAIVTSQIAEGYWVPQSATSKWIAPSENQSYPGATPCNAAGTYVYRTTFSLAGFNPATAKITGEWGADNSGTAVRLNGVSLGITAGSYSPLTPFTIDAGFVAGTNTLDFEISDVGCPNGLRVELRGTAAFTE